MNTDLPLPSTDRANVAELRFQLDRAGAAVADLHAAMTAARRAAGTSRRLQDGAANIIANTDVIIAQIESMSESFHQLVALGLVEP